MNSAGNTAKEHDYFFVSSGYLWYEFEGGVDEIEIRLWWDDENLANNPENNLFLEI